MCGDGDAWSLGIPAISTDCLPFLSQHIGHLPGFLPFPDASRRNICPESQVKDLLLSPS